MQNEFVKKEAINFFNFVRDNFYVDGSPKLRPFDYDKYKSSTIEEVYEIYLKRCFDAFNNEIFVGDLLQVQNESVLRKVYKKEDGELYFTPYDKEDKVGAYFKDDIIKIID